jgi:hypothetical protein
MNIRLVTIVLALFSILFAACEADLDIKNVSDEIALQPSLVVPVAGVSVNLGQFLSAHYQGTNLDLSDNLEINYINEDSAEYSVAYGDFESTAIVSFVHQRKLELGKVFPNGFLKFSNPQLHIRVTSNIGTYLSFRVDYIKAIVSTDSTIAPVYAWFNAHTTNSVTEQFDSKPASPSLWVSKDFRTFDKDWGETNWLFENVNRPDMIEYKFSAWINQALVQKDPTPAFITPDAKLKVNISYKIPFQLNKGSYYDYQDTIPNIFSQIAGVFDKYAADKISSATIVLNIKNGFPVQTQFTVQFLDSLGQKLLTDFEKNYTVQAGDVDANGIVQTGKETKQTITLLVTKAQLPELKKAKSIAYSVRFLGEDVQSNIHFTKLNTFDLKVGLFVKGDLNEKLGTLIQH